MASVFAIPKYPSPSPLREEGIMSTIRLFPAVVTNPKVNPCNILTNKNNPIVCANGYPTKVITNKKYAARYRGLRYSKSNTNPAAGRINKAAIV